MTTIDALVKLKNNADELSRSGGMIPLLVETFTAIIPQIEDKNIEQLKRGERGDGSRLPNYSPVSVAKFGKPAGPIKLYDQGGFYGGVAVKVSQGGIEIYDTDYKADLLEGIYGGEILDLQQRSLDELKEDAVLPEIHVRILEKLAA